ncbi:MAG: 4-(cytidine 5'-diphospho)-2-C-methyl-D-erythritol kinase [Candidatus Bipolaricaulota bacterium]|nr:4-(cytidine 5'-diphospho)-2-C-methyl-D-erythritol kinase [Candidatus Bipolaricaulota bacterium]
MLHAYAKLNLSLRVTRRRNDGFHDLDSLVQTIDLADTITLERTTGKIEVENDLGIPFEEDLAARAALLLLQEKRVEGGIRIRVRKKIPMGAGLGGGSSDAAAVLWGVDRVTPPSISHVRLSLLAARLGSDLPLFLTGGLLRLSGRGERITPLPHLRTERFVILVPPVHCATAAVYDRFDRLGSSTGRKDSYSLGENDLYRPALSLYPLLIPYARAIEAVDADYSGMSGSGSAFFAAFADETGAHFAQRDLAATFPTAFVHLCDATDSGYHLCDETDTYRD